MTQITSLAAKLTVMLMVLSFVLAVQVHMMRRELDPAAMPLSAYLSGSSRRVGLACYACLVAGIATFALATVSRPGLDVGLTAVAALYLLSVVFVAIAAATARADMPLAHVDNPRTRWWHRKSAFLAFLFAITAIVLHTWRWRDEEFLKPAGPLLGVLAATLVALFVVLSLLPLKFKAIVQKSLIVGILVWFSWVALMMQN